MEFIKQEPSEVSRNRIVYVFQQNLKEINSDKIKLENSLRDGINQLTEHCLNIRGQIDLATEKAIQDIQDQRNELLKKVDEYERECFLRMQSEKEAKLSFEMTIKELDQFNKRWSSYLNNPTIDDREVSNSNDIAIELKKEAQMSIRQLDVLIFNDKKIYFENNSEKFRIGDIKFENKILSRKIDSLILSAEQKASLLSLIGFESKKFHLLWRGSRDGFGAGTFHSLCDGSGPTLTVVKSRTGFIFGGYTSVSWTSCGNYKRDNRAFLFTLTNPQNMPLKLMNKGDEYSVRDYSLVGPTFGLGTDLFVTSDSNLNARSRCYPGNSYEAPNGQNGSNGGKFIHGGGMGSDIEYFSTVEVEVFLVS